MSRLFALSLSCVLSVGCGEPEQSVLRTTPTGGAYGPSLVDHEGNTIALRSGFADSYEDAGQTHRFVVLTNMDDGCASLAWWAQRDAALSDMFFADPFDEPGFEEAIANTGAVFADEMSTDRPWYVIVDAGPVALGAAVERPGATLSSEWGEEVFWGTANSLTAPVYESGTSTTGGTFRSYGPGGYEADNNGGTLSVTFDEAGARGALDTTFETDELAQFDLVWDFDVPNCSDAFDY